MKQSSKFHFNAIQVGDLIGSLVAKSVLELEGIAKSILTAGNEENAEGEDAQLIDSGTGITVIAAALKQLEGQTSQAKAAEAWKETSLQLELFLASVRVHKFV